MIKNIVKAIAGLGKSLDKPTFVKDYESTDSLISELEALKKQVEDETVIESIDRDIVLIKYGNDGERNVAYELKNSFIPMYIIHNLTIQYEDYKAQLDYVLVTSRFICILETKKLNGDITINNDGDFIRHFKNRQGKTVKKEGMYSPVSQNQRHVRILKELLMRNGIIRDTPVLSLVVIANPKSIINHKYAKREIKNQIVKYDQLTPRINRILEQNDKKENSLKAMQKICEFLMSENVEPENGFLTKYKEYVVEQIKEEEIIETFQDTGEPLAVEKSQDIEAVRVKLSTYRLEQSRLEKVKAYYIFNNKQMEELLEKRPLTKEALMECSGFGKVKVEKYGDKIIELIGE